MGAHAQSATMAGTSCLGLSMGRSLRALALLLWLSLAACTGSGDALPASEPSVRVHAAASLAEAMADVDALWQAQGHPALQLVLAGSSTLARQIQAGAPADVFISADVAWMDTLQEAGRLQPQGRIDLLGNRLVLVAPRGQAPVPAVRMEAGFPIATAFDGRLCTGEPGVVPVGRYAQQALAHLGWWQTLQGRIVGTADVRAALNFVERGECALGIVYATDAAGSAHVDVVGEFPVASHAPIVYPLALVQGAGPQAAAFARFVQQSPDVRAALQRRGFAWLPGSVPDA